MNSLGTFIASKVPTRFSSSTRILEIRSHAVVLSDTFANCAYTSRIHVREHPSLAIINSFLRMKGRGNDGDSSGAASYVKPASFTAARGAHHAWNIKDLLYSGGW